MSSADCVNVPLVIVSFVTAWLAELAGAALGFGPAILYQVSWQLCAIIGIASGSLQTAVTNILIEDAPCGLVQLFVLREHLQRRLCIVACLPVVLTLPLGTQILERFGASPWMKRVLGIILLIILAIQIRRKPKLSARHDLEERNVVVIMAIVVALGSTGFMRGLFGICSPPVLLLLMFFSVDSRVWRCVANLVRVTMILVQSILVGLRPDRINPHCLPLYIALMIGGLAGLATGNYIASYIDQQQFHTWLMLFLASAALLMLCSETLLSPLAAICVMLAALLTLVAPVIAPRVRLLFLRSITESDARLIETNSCKSGDGTTADLETTVGAQNRSLCEIEPPRATL